MKNNPKNRRARKPTVTWPHVFVMMMMGMLTPLLCVLTFIGGIYFLATGQVISSICMLVATRFQFLALKTWNVIVDYEKR